MPQPAEDSLLQVVVTLLAPVFLPLVADAAAARHAAIAAIERMRTRTQGDLLTIAQAIAFGIANIPMLVQSLKADVDPALLVWLNRNVSSLSRTEFRYRRILRQTKGAAARQPAW